jgi:hypothetical protein
MDAARLHRWAFVGQRPVLPELFEGFDGQPGKPGLQQTPPPYNAAGWASDCSTSATSDSTVPG